ncbi:Fc.00g114640.m01.CDS01 [Cosmosporella sp. VM-42]
MKLNLLIKKFGRHPIKVHVPIDSKVLGMRYSTAPVECVECEAREIQFRSTAKYWACSQQRHSTAPVECVECEAREIQFRSTAKYWACGTAPHPLNVLNAKPEKSSSDRQQSTGHGRSLWVAFAIGVMVTMIGKYSNTQNVMGLSNQSFIHPPLNESFDSLRLIQLRPGSPGDPVSCSIYTSTFAQIPKYMALSYHWQGQEGSKLIQINGADFPVGQNLYDALKYLRDPQKSRTLWVDALCINQRNTTEKDVQLPLMSFVYSRASDVIVWLAEPETVHSDDMNALSEHFHNTHDRWDDIKPWIYRLIHQEYWKRAWVVQEIGLADNIIVQFGSHSLKWDIFVSIVEEYKSLAPQDRRVENILRLQRLRSTKYGDQKQYSLRALLKKFRDVHCEQVHDRVYAFRGLAKDQLNGGLPASYHKSIEEVYADIIRFEKGSDLYPNTTAREMVFFSGLVRQILTRKSERVSVAVPIRSQSRISKAKRDPLMQTTVWHPINQEDAKFWIDNAVEDVSNIMVRGSLAAEVELVGPRVDELASSYRKVKKWKDALISHLVKSPRNRSKAIARNEYLAWMLKDQDRATANIHTFGFDGASVCAMQDGWLSSLWSSSETGCHSPVIFLGSNGTLGLAPYGTIRKDRIYQFWNSSASAVARPRRDKPLVFLGRAMIASNTAAEWEIPKEKKLFDAGAEGTVLFNLSLKGLTKLSLDSVRLPYVS